jgi:hypothetical protein
MENKIIEGRSFCVCQDCYDRRQMRGVVYTDEIVNKNNCAICSRRKKRSVKPIDIAIERLRKAVKDKKFYSGLLKKLD